MKDMFKKVQHSKETRNLKSWAVKLPEDTIEELERVFKSSGIRFKNEFIERMLKEHKFQLSLEEDVENDALIHPEISKTSVSDLKEINRLTQNIRSVYMSQAEKLSSLQYEIDQLKKENTLLKKNSSQSVINDYLLESSKKEVGNQIFLGTSGVGKTYAMGLEMNKTLKQGKRVVIVDLQGEYKGLTDSVGGCHIELGKDCLNPFEFYTNDECNYKLNEKIMDMLSFVELLMKRPSTSHTRKILLTAIENTYNAFGFRRDDDAIGETFPTLGDLEKTLRQTGGEAIQLADELDPFTIGILSEFNGERNVNIVESPILHFDLRLLDSYIAEAGIFHTLEFIYMMIRNNLLNDCVFVFDETWMLQNNQIIRLFQKILHFGKEVEIRFMISTQQTAEFYKNLDSILSYFDTTVYFKQALPDLNYLKTHLDIDKHQLDLLKTAQKGDCIVVSKEDFPFYMKYPEVREITMLLNPLSNYLAE